MPEHAGVILENNHYVTAVRSSTGGSNINPIREYNSEGINTEDRYDPDIKNANYYRYTYPHSGVYFKVNGKLTQAKKLGGIIGLSNIIFGLWLWIKNQKTWINGLNRIVDILRLFLLD